MVNPHFMYIYIERETRWAGEGGRDLHTLGHGVGWGLGGETGAERLPFICERSCADYNLIFIFSFVIPMLLQVAAPVPGLAFLCRLL